MAEMPASGQISIDDARTVFGEAGQLSLGDLYRGGGIVPDSSVNSGVPTSGQISLSNLYSAASSVAIDVTIGSDTDGITYSRDGYLSGVMGSRSPTTYEGSSILSAHYLTTIPGGDGVFIFRLAGSHSQSLFESLTPEGQSTLTSASASFSQPGGNTQWQWSVGSNPWSAIGGQVREVLIVP